MPIYTLRCTVCGHEEEVLCKPEERHVHDVHGGALIAGEGVVFFCPIENAPLFWKGPELSTLDFNGNAAGRFQMKAVTSQGKIAGHFGKSARNK